MDAKVLHISTDKYYDRPARTVLLSMNANDITERLVRDLTIATFYGDNQFGTVTLQSPACQPEATAQHIAVSIPQMRALIAEFHAWDGNEEESQPTTDHELADAAYRLVSYLKSASFNEGCRPYLATQVSEIEKLLIARGIMAAEEAR